MVSKYENSLGYPTYDILIKISDYFGVTTDYLLGASKRKTIDVLKLTDSQIETIHKLITEFTKSNNQLQVIYYCIGGIFYFI